MNNQKLINIVNTPAYYINLDRDVEKSEKIQELLSSLGFINVIRFPGIKEDIKKVGVAKSHNALLKELSNEQTPFIVFEDDILKYKFTPNLLIPEDADAFYLGNSLFGLKNGIGQKRIIAKHYDFDIFRIYNMLAAHAILYTNNDYVRFLAKATEFNISIADNQDKARAETMKYWNIYANRLPMFYQNGVHSQFTKIDLASITSLGPEWAYLK
jgi:GR25 family glycosyltransferase involved in LPS biosynthesis